MFGARIRFDDRYRAQLSRIRCEDRHYHRRRCTPGYTYPPAWRQGHTGMFSETLGGRGGRDRCLACEALTTQIAPARPRNRSRRTVLAEGSVGFGSRPDRGSPLARGAGWSPVGRAPPLSLVQCFQLRVLGSWSTLTQTIYINVYTRYDTFYVTRAIVCVHIVSRAFYYTVRLPTRACASPRRNGSDESRRFTRLFGRVLLLLLLLLLP